MLYSRNDVLPAIGGEHSRFQALRFCSCECTTGGAEEIFRVRCRLRRKDAVHCTDQFNEFIDSLVARAGGELLVLRGPLELIEHHVLALIAPMKVEHVLEQRAQLLARSDALLEVRLNEQFDMTRE